MDPLQADQAHRAGPDLTPLARGGESPRAPKRWRWLALAAAIPIIGVTVLVTSKLIDSARPATELALAGRLALLPFVDATPDRSGGWVESGLMEMVAETVARSAGGAVVSPKRLRRALEPRGFDLNDPADRERARDLALATGADQILDVTLTRHRGQGYAMEIELYDGDGLVDGARLERPDPLEAADALAFSLARGLSSDLEPYRLQHQYSRSAFIDRLYATGLGQLHGASPETARPYFEIALKHRSGFFQAKARLVDCLRLTGELDAAAELTGELVLEAQSRGDRALEARSLRTLASLDAIRGRLEEASGRVQQAFALHLDMADRPAQAEALYEMARLALTQGDPSRAEDFYVERLRIQQELGDRLGEADTLYQIGSLQLSGGNLAAAQRVLADARQVAVETGDVWVEMRVAASQGEAAQRQGEFETADRLWRRALAFYEQHDETARRLLLSDKLARLSLQRGDLDQTEDLLLDLRELAAEHGDRPYEAKASLGLAWAMLRTGYPNQAKPHLDRALELDRWLDDRKLMQLVIAWYAYEQGSYRLAVQTQAGIKRHSPDRWFAGDEAFLKVYREAEILGRRLPLPGETGYAEPATPSDS